MEEFEEKDLQVYIKLTCPINFCAMTIASDFIEAYWSVEGDYTYILMNSGKEIHVMESVEEIDEILKEGLDFKED